MRVCTPLEIDNGANLDTTNGTLYLGYGEGGLILNGGASITRRRRRPVQ